MSADVRPLLVFGAGGHAKVIVDLALDLGIEVAGLVIPHGTGHGYRGLPLLADQRLDPDSPASHDAVVAIGSNSARRRVGNELVAAGYTLPPLIASSAVVSVTAAVGEGAVVMHGAVIQADTRIGRLAVVNTSASVDHDGDIGEAAHIAPGCRLAGNVTIGDSTFLGAGTTVIPQITVGDGSMVGAGSTLVRDVPGGVIAWGVPARIRREWKA